MASGVLRRLLRAAVCLCALGLARTAGAQAAPPKPLTLGRITLAGYLQLDYLTPIEGPRVQPAIDDPLVEDETVVDVARARVSASGQLGSRVTWLVMGDFAALPENVLRDASVTVRLAPAASVRLGQYSIPYSLERMTSTAVIETIDRSILGTALTPSRDLGVTVFSPAPIRGWFMYWGSVIAGAGANTPDNNGARDLVGRVAIRPPQAKGLSIGVNGETGKQPVGDRRRTGIDVSLRARTGSSRRRGAVAVNRRRHRARYARLLRAGRLASAGRLTQAMVRGLRARHAVGRRR